jgi:hypothetical protein
MKIKVKLILIAISLFFAFSIQVKSQLITSGGLTAQQLVQNILVGNGVTVSNVTATGPANCLGKFTTGASATNLGLASGIVMSTGGFANVPNANSYFLSNSLSGSGDPLLATLSGGYTSYDAVVLEFDFIPLSNTVNFRYVFVPKNTQNMFAQILMMLSVSLYLDQILLEVIIQIKMLQLFLEQLYLLLLIL